MKSLFYTAIAVFIGLAGVVAFYALQTPEDAASTRVVLHIDTSEMPDDDNGTASVSSDTSQAEDTAQLYSSTATPDDVQAGGADTGYGAAGERKPLKSYGRLSERDAPEADISDLDEPAAENRDAPQDPADVTASPAESLSSDRSNDTAVEADSSKPDENSSDDRLAYLPGTTLGPIESNEAPEAGNNAGSSAPSDSIGGISVTSEVSQPKAEEPAKISEAGDDEAQRLVDELAASIDTQANRETVASETIAASEDPSQAEQLPGNTGTQANSEAADPATGISESAEPQIADEQAGTDKSDPVAAANAEIAALLREASQSAASQSDASAVVPSTQPEDTQAAAPAEETPDATALNEVVASEVEAENVDAESQETEEQPSQLAALTPEVAAEAATNEEAVVLAPPSPERRPASIPSVEVAAANGWADSIAASAGRKPAKVALLLRGVGLNSADSQAAIDNLPSAVSLGFLPDGDALLWAVRAKERGHEVIVQLPLEPNDYPQNNPSPNTLLSSDSVEQNVSRLSSVLSNFEGYSGVTNYHGSKFLRSKEALRPILENVKSRGLIYVGEGTSSHNVARSLAEEIKLRYGQPSVKIESNASPLTVKRALARLIAIAHNRGSAIAIGDVSAATVEQVQAWSQSLAAHGITLVPVGALAQADGAS